MDLLRTKSKVGLIILGSNKGKYGKTRAIKGKYAQIRVIKPKYSQI